MLGSIFHSAWSHADIVFAVSLGWEAVTRAGWTSSLYTAHTLPQLRLPAEINSLSVALDCRHMTKQPKCSHRELLLRWALLQRSADLRICAPQLTCWQRTCCKESLRNEKWDNTLRLWHGERWIIRSSWIECYMPIWYTCKYNWAELLLVTEEQPGPGGIWFKTLMQRVSFRCNVDIFLAHLVRRNMPVTLNLLWSIPHQELVQLWQGIELLRYLGYTVRADKDQHAACRAAKPWLVAAASLAATQTGAYCITRQRFVWSDRDPFIKDKVPAFEEPSISELLNVSLDPSCI